MGTLPMFCIEKPFCACTAQRIAWCLQNRILVSVKIKLLAITSGNDNKTRPYMVIYSTAPWAINNIPAPKAGPWKVQVQVSCIQCLGLYHPRAFMYFLGSALEVHVQPLCSTYPIHCTNYDTTITCMLGLHTGRHNLKVLIIKKHLW